MLGINLEIRDGIQLVAFGSTSEQVVVNDLETCDSMTMLRAFFPFRSEEKMLKQ
jgi:hypothetical protein